MKARRLFLLAGCLMVVSSIMAQINIKEPIKQPTSIPYVQKYDSLTNITALQDDSITHSTSLKHLIGQIVYYVEPDTTKYGIRHKRLYDTPNIRYGVQHLPKEVWANRYLKIIDYKEIASAYSKKNVLELQDTATGRSIYCETNGLNRDFVVLGYYEKLKKTYIGKSFVLKKRFSYGIADSYDGYRKFGNLINYDTNEIGDSIPYNSIWKCVDIAVSNVTSQIRGGKGDNRCPVILIFENDKFGKYYSYTQNHLGKPFNETEGYFYGGGSNDLNFVLHLGKFLDEEQVALKEQKDKEYKIHLQRQRKKMIAKYGKYWGELVAEMKLEIGMTKQMCRDSWGEPQEINRTTTQYGSHEQWVYYTTYIYFDNGKITAIQDR